MDGLFNPPGFKFPTIQDMEEETLKRIRSPSFWPNPLDLSLGLGVAQEEPEEEEEEPEDEED